MNGISRYFMIVAALAVTLGMTWGIQMSATGNHDLSPAHGHLNLIGFVSFSIFAFYYHLMPAAGAGRLAQVHFGVALAGLITIVPGIVLALREQGEGLAKLGSVLSLASMLIFLTVVIRNRRTPS